VGPKGIPIYKKGAKNGGTGNPPRHPFFEREPPSTTWWKTGLKKDKNSPGNPLWGPKEEPRNPKFAA